MRDNEIAIEQAVAARMLYSIPSKVLYSIHPRPLF
jgi:hypothetical protein